MNRLLWLSKTKLVPWIWTDLNWFFDFSYALPQVNILFKELKKLYNVSTINLYVKEESILENTKHNIWHIKPSPDLKEGFDFGRCPLGKEMNGIKLKHMV